MIADYRYVVIGQRPDGRRWPIAAKDTREEAQQILNTGRVVNNVRWSGVRIHDRRTQGLMPQGGWAA